MNTWPKGKREALSQDQHEQWNARTFPGTRQLCSFCGEPTGRCSEDELRMEYGDGPYCEPCFDRAIVPDPNT